MISILILLPLLFSFLIYLFGRNFNKYGINLLNILFFNISFINILFLLTNNSNIYTIIFKKWLSISYNLISFTILINSQTIILISIIILIFTIIIFYSSNYMTEDPGLILFLGHLYLFLFFMLLLISANDLYVLFIGWEGVGLCSYLLVKFWNTKILANKSAIKALIYNKIGDLGLLLAFTSIWYIYGLNSLSLLLIIKYVIYNYIIILIFIGIIAKSAQIGLHNWLPDAMEGPTPISALIHAATMVVAGVYLLIKFSSLLGICYIIKFILILFGSFTSIFFSIVAFYKYDIKKIIAYSTCSQLGFMVTIIGFNYYNLSLFHIINHASFKALLFLGAGIIISSNYSEQDLRRIGSISPIYLWFIILGSISLIAIPFTSGFYSKDLILECTYSSNIFIFAYWFSLFACTFSALYSIKIIYYIYFTVPNNKSLKYSINNIKFIYILLPLAFFSLCVGYFLQYYILLLKFPIIVNNYIKFLPLLFSLLSIPIIILIKYIISWKSYISLFWIGQINNYIDNINFHKITKPLYIFSYSNIYILVDKIIIEHNILNSIVENIKWLSQKSSQYHHGYYGSYIFFFFFILILSIKF
uniref:NADH dehydrogenase subunit 5 n=1 Tax=Gymnopraia lapislazula TaxID=316224 RepID=UPI0026E1EA2F|nr:NADH dehydrogenase subunit 5 [Gymnopraia lapislazula]WJJ70119.1 NADH dehydrogenase subunit 5 [Gymnopraia lapislazula]